jgi:uncharacterized protein (DUF1697 family)
MPSYVALLRAVNVGGRFYKMADLRQHLEDSGLVDVETYIQTGNVRFRSAMRSPMKVEGHVESVLGDHCGFEVPAVIFTPAELRAIRRDAETLPVPSFAEDREVRRYVSFFKAGAAPAGEVARAIADWDAPGEAADVIGRAVHVWIDGPMHEAKFFGAFKKPLAPGTARDLKVVRALDERWGA